MTIMAHIPWTDETKANLRAYAHRIHEDYRECLKCGCPYVTSGRYQEALCVECSGTYNTWDRERRQYWQREYKKKYKRVEIDRRRKENKDERQNIIR